MSFLGKDGRKRVREYFLGLLYTYLAVIVFAALGWITVTADFTASNLIVTLLVAVIVWTALAFVGLFVWAILLVVAASSSAGGVFVLIGLAFVGYALLKAAEFILPIGWVAFTHNEFAFLVMGAVFAAIHLLVDSHKRSELEKIFSK